MNYTFAVGLVYADGNPQTEASGLNPAEALGWLMMMEAKYPKTPPAIIVWDEDDPERGYFDADSLLDEIVEEPKQEWPEYAARFVAEENGPDMNSEDLFDTGLGEVDGSGE